MNTTMEQKIEELLQRVRRLTDARVVSVTQAEFDKLPWLVTRKTFMQWTGLDKDEIGEEVSRGQIKVWRPKHRSQAKYYKVEIARLCGLKL